MPHYLQGRLNILLLFFFAASTLIVSAFGCHGQSNAPPEAPLPKEFIYPYSVGTSWSYTYHYYHRETENGINDSTRGLRQWEVTSVDQKNDLIVALVSVSSIDTVHRIRAAWAWGYSQDTTFINRQSSSFTVTRFSDSISVRWTSNTIVTGRNIQTLETLPRYAESNTLTYGDMFSSVWYASGVGLTKYSGGHISNTFEDESLILVRSTIN